MIYPLVSEYIDAILNSTDNFDQLSNLTPVLDSIGKPIMSTGNYSVVFKMVDRQNGKLYAIKCFTKEQAGRDNSYKEIAEELEYVTTSYMTDVQYLENELFVYSSKTTQTEFPVVLMDWVDGMNLSEYLDSHPSKEDLYQLSLSFSDMAMWLISQPFSHGDIKPDNIIVRDDKSLVLVDYDGMFLASMKGQIARELGTPDFRHPYRSNHPYDEHIDDFSIVVILLSLMLIHEEPNLYKKERTSEGLLFSERDFYDINACSFYQELKARHSNNVVISNLILFFEKCLQQGNLSKTDIYKVRLPEILDTTIVQGNIASSKITELLWEFSRKTYMRDLNLTENILRFSADNQEIKFVTHNKKIYVGASINGTNYMYGYSFEGLKKLLLTTHAWDRSIESKLMILYNEIQFSSPELMLVSARTYIENNFPNLIDKITTTISGYTLIITFVGGVKGIEKQHLIFNLLSDETFKKNSERFGLSKIIVIEAESGMEQHFDIKNL